MSRWKRAQIRITANSQEKKRKRIISFSFHGSFPRIIFFFISYADMGIRPPFDLSVVVAVWHMAFFFLFSRPLGIMERRNRKWSSSSSSSSSFSRIRVFDLDLVRPWHSLFPRPLDSSYSLVWIRLCPFSFVQMREKFLQRFFRSFYFFNGDCPWVEEEDFSFLWHRHPLRVQERFFIRRMGAHWFPD